MATKKPLARINSSPAPSRIQSSREFIRNLSYHRPEMRDGPRSGTPRTNTARPRDTSTSETQQPVIRSASEHCPHEMDRDYHVHSTYSDGRFLFQMVRAAAEADLDGVGIADHCSVSDREEIQEQKHLLGFNLDQTYERRREAIERLREETDIAIYDGVEMDYHPDEEQRIRSFLDEAEFQYAIGSVHHLEGVNVHVERYFE